MNNMHRVYGGQAISNMADVLATGAVLLFMVQLLPSLLICSVKIDQSVDKCRTTCRQVTTATNIPEYCQHFLLCYFLRNNSPMMDCWLDFSYSRKWSLRETDYTFRKKHFTNRRFLCFYIGCMLVTIMDDTAELQQPDSPVLTEQTMVPSVVDMTYGPSVPITHQTRPGVPDEQVTVTHTLKWWVMPQEVTPAYWDVWLSNGHLSPPSFALKYPSPSQQSSIQQSTIIFFWELLFPPPNITVVCHSHQALFWSPMTKKHTIILKAPLTFSENS